MTEATTINIVGVAAVTIDLRSFGPLAAPPFAEYCWCLVGGLDGVDRSDRKLINDAPAALRIEDRLLSLPVSSLAQLEG